jgi:hypothetical protein
MAERSAPLVMIDRGPGYEMMLCGQVAPWTRSS